jgi:hypothetical protein
MYRALLQMRFEVGLVDGAAYNQRYYRQPAIPKRANAVTKNLIRN